MASESSEITTKEINFHDGTPVSFQGHGSAAKAKRRTPVSVDKKRPQSPSPSWSTAALKSPYSPESNPFGPRPRTLTPAGAAGHSPQSPFTLPNLFAEVEPVDIGLADIERTWLSAKTLAQEYSALAANIDHKVDWCSDYSQVCTKVPRISPGVSGLERGLGLHAAGKVEASTPNSSKRATGSELMSPSPGKKAEGWQLTPPKLSITADAECASSSPHQALGSAYDDNQENIPANWAGTSDKHESPQAWQMRTNNPAFAGSSPSASNSPLSAHVPSLLAAGYSGGLSGPCQTPETEGQPLPRSQDPSPAHMFPMSYNPMELTRSTSLESSTSRKSTGTASSDGRSQPITPNLQYTQRRWPQEPLGIDREGNTLADGMRDSEAAYASARSASVPSNIHIQGGEESQRGAYLCQAYEELSDNPAHMQADVVATISLVSGTTKEPDAPDALSDTGSKLPGPSRLTRSAGKKRLVELLSGSACPEPQSSAPQRSVEQTSASQPRRRSSRIHSLVVLLTQLAIVAAATCFTVSYPDIVGTQVYSTRNKAIPQGVTVFPCINHELWHSTFGIGTLPKAVAPKGVSWWDSLSVSTVEKPTVAASSRTVGQQTDGRQHAEGDAGKKAGLAASLIQKAASTYQQRPPADAAPPVHLLPNEAELTSHDGKPEQGPGIAALLRRATKSKANPAVDPATGFSVAIKEDAKAAAKEPARPGPSSQRASPATVKVPPVPTDRAGNTKAARNSGRSGSLEPADVLSTDKSTATRLTSAGTPKETGAVQQLLKLMQEHLCPLAAVLMLSLAATLAWLLRSDRRTITDGMLEEGREMEEDVRVEDGQQLLTPIPEEEPFRESSPPVACDADDSDTEAEEDDDTKSHKSLSAAIRRSIPRSVRKTVSRSVKKGMQSLSAVTGSKAAEGPEAEDEVGQPEVSSTKKTRNRTLKETQPAPAPTPQRKTTTSRATSARRPAASPAASGASVPGRRYSTRRASQA